jgi:hypothetical protein
MFSNYTTTNDINYLLSGSSAGVGGIGLQKSNMVNGMNGTLNGRVDLMTPENDKVLFKMQERIAIKNKATDYYSALDGTLECSVLSQIFFSAKNTQILQNGIRAGVYKMSGNKYIIGIPNLETLRIIMRSTFLNYAEHNIDNITKQVEDLNKIVLDYAVPETFGAAVSYEKYLEDQSTLVVPLDLPQQTDKNIKQLELKPFF